MVDHGYIRLPDERSPYSGPMVRLLNLRGVPARPADSDDLLRLGRDFGTLTPFSFGH